MPQFFFRQKITFVMSYLRSDVGRSQRCGCYASMNESNFRIMCN